MTPRTTDNSDREQVLTWLAGRLRFAGEIFDLDAVANATLAKVAVEHPLSLKRRRRAPIRTQGHADDDPSPLKRSQAFAQAHGRFHFPWMLRRFGEAGHEIGPGLQPKRNNQVIVIDLFSGQGDFLALLKTRQEALKAHPASEETAVELADVERRIAKLVDREAPLLEVGLWAGYGMYADWGGAPAAGVVSFVGPDLYLTGEASEQTFHSARENGIGFIAAFPSSLNPTLGFSALRAFPAAILGGLDSPGGAVLGGIIIGLVEVLTQGYQPEYAPWLGNNFHVVMPYVVMVVILMIRPFGLFGTREVQRL